MQLRGPQIREASSKALVLTPHPDQLRPNDSVRLLKAPIRIYQTHEIGAQIEGSHRKSIKITMNGVPVAPHGLKFGQTETYRLQEAF